MQINPGMANVTLFEDSIKAVEIKNVEQKLGEAGIHSGCVVAIGEFIHAS